MIRSLFHTRLGESSLARSAVVLVVADEAGCHVVDAVVLLLLLFLRIDMHVRGVVLSNSGHTMLRKQGFLQFTPFSLYDDSDTVHISQVRSCFPRIIWLAKSCRMQE